MSAGMTPVNNALYDELGERWYTAQDNPVALLRAEGRLRNPWIAMEIATRCGVGAAVLDIGCGGGFCRMNSREPVLPSPVLIGRQRA